MDARRDMDESSRTKPIGSHVNSFRIGRLKLVVDWVRREVVQKLRELTKKAPRKATGTIKPEATATRGSAALFLKGLKLGLLLLFVF
jgi:hypothetical protein